MVSKSTLPTKQCAACLRPFTWRRAWARSWPEVRYCSDACRSGRRARAIARLSSGQPAPAQGRLHER